MIPVQLRVGGAFVALALVFIIHAAMAFVRGEALFAFTPQVLSILAATAVFGANATFVRGQRRSRGQVVALAVAVLLVVAGVLAPRAELFVAPTYWLVLWACVAGVCALILRRSAS